ncbi:MAG: glutamine--fructose-6-phosphate transaminase (isomerizing) [Alphaproteobacteria bacterium]|nr:glutamine--fructose-6-phosphate transaminase (isomerizing) [Alphaproteobacteria bacterium]OJV46986.1 MAG: glutamine--fructose-6-phosphate aminotransferase [Alphaproteobacteria bacterium 43-37]
MCGIIAIISQNQPVSERIISGLKRLEYRGYDSSGVATITPEGTIDVRRAVGKIASLQALVEQLPLTGKIGIGHTRWATHGAAVEDNAHPHSNGRVAVVHNGIIENFAELRRELEQKDHVFSSQTDTESIVHLITDFLDQGMRPEQAMKETLAHLEGAFGIAVLFQGEELIIGARKGSPLAVGLGDTEMYLGSDALGLAPFTDQMVYLEEGDWVILRDNSYQIFNAQSEPVERAKTLIAANNMSLAKDGFAHFMLKEIFEQPSVVGQTLSNCLDPHSRLPDFSGLNLPRIEPFQRLNIIACGTSYLAAMVAKYWLESLTDIHVNVDIASEFRYRRTPFVNGGVAVFISQSGETADTLAAMTHAKENGQFCIAVVNVATSSMARLADAVILTDAGAEIGVASTKAFTCQLVVLAAFTVFIALQHGSVTLEQGQQFVEELTHIPSQIQDQLHHKEELQQLAQAYLVHARDILYIGRGAHYPIALEGALKLKELSYIHAEGFPAGELKHGPIALIDQDVPVIVLAPFGPLFDKTISNAFEVAARGAKVILVTDKQGKSAVERMGQQQFTLFEVSTAGTFSSPLLCAIPMQLMAYYTALLKGTDVDQPRNLAKSVTVE